MQNKNIIMSNSNNLKAYLQELESAKINKTNSFELSPNSQITQNFDKSQEKNFLIFPENSKLYYNFKFGKIQNIDITYSTGCQLKGILKKTDEKFFGILKTGKFIFRDKSFILFERENLKLLKSELFDQNGNFLKKLEKFPYTFLERENPLRKTIIDKFFIFDGVTDNDGNFVKGTCYSNLGIFYSKFDFLDMKNRFGIFFEKFGHLKVKKKNCFLDEKNLEFNLRMFNENKKLLCFGNEDLEGEFFFYVENCKNPKNGVGFYKHKNFIKKLSFIQKNNQILFLHQLNLYNLKEITNFLQRKESENISENESFVKLDSQNENSFENEKDDLNLQQIKNKYFSSLEKILKKYDNLSENKNKENKISKNLISDLERENLFLNKQISDLEIIITQTCNKLFEEQSEKEKIEKKNIVFKKNKNLLIKKIKELKVENKIFEKTNNKIKEIYNRKEKEFLNLVDKFKKKKIEEKNNEKIIDLKFNDIYYQLEEEKICLKKKNMENMILLKQIQKMKINFENECSILETKNEEIENFKKKSEFENLEKEDLKKEIGNLKNLVDLKNKIIEDRNNVMEKNTISELEKNSEDQKIIFEYKKEIEKNIVEKKQFLILKEKLKKQIDDFIEKNAIQEKLILNKKLKNENLEKKLEEQKFENKNLLMKKDGLEKFIKNVKSENHKLLEEKDSLKNFLKKQKFENKKLLEKNEKLKNMVTEEKSKIENSFHKVEELKNLLKKIKFGKNNLLKENTELKNLLKKEKTEKHNLLLKTENFKKKEKIEKNHLLQDNNKLKNSLIKENSKNQNLLKQKKDLENLLLLENSKNNNLLKEKNELKNILKKNNSEKKNLQIKKSELENLLNKQKSKNFKNLKTFKGEIKNGLKTGFIIEENENLKFEGNYENGKKKGFGILKNENYEFSGNFENDQFSGNGKLNFFEKNKILEGNFKNGFFEEKKAKIGKVLFFGSIKNNFFDGKGYFEFLNNSILEANFEKDEIRQDDKINFLDISNGKEEELFYSKDKKFFVNSNSDKFFVDFEKGMLLRENEFCK